MARSVSLAGGVGQGTVIRVAIVADIRLYREGLARILERQPNISVVATAATSDGSLAPLSQLADVGLPFQDPSQALSVQPDVGYDGHPDHCALTHATRLAHRARPGRAKNDR